MKLYTQRNKINEPCTCGDGKFAAMAQGTMTALARAPDDAQATPAKSGRYAGMFRGAA